MEKFLVLHSFAVGNLIILPFFQKMLYMKLRPKRMKLTLHTPACIVSKFQNFSKPIIHAEKIFHVLES